MCQSSLIAATGSTRIARTAGTTQPAVAVTVMIAATLERVDASQGATRTPLPDVLVRGECEMAFELTIQLAIRRAPADGVHKSRPVLAPDARHRVSPAGSAPTPLTAWFSPT
jgi:hypothetical protein